MSGDMLATLPVVLIAMSWHAAAAVPALYLFYTREILQEGAANVGRREQ